jgi:NDP-4-keto-2,6-dideoxyhexose 3-C-methyltransferase
MRYKQIDHCRICGNINLRTILDLGNLSLTGIFPYPGEDVDMSPLELVKCFGGNDVCGLVQLRHTYDLNTLYGDTYGYRSGLNMSMVKHLEGIVGEIEERIELKDGDLIVDIASNDGVLLGAYKNTNLTLVGIDPAAKKFGEYYKSYIMRFAEFFSSSIIKKNFQQKAKVITSIAMFYDLEEPLTFMKEISEALADDGIWVLEQSYLPLMIRQNSYDTICHEHLEYYSLFQIDWMTKVCGLRILDVDFNGANGGSFRVTISHKDSQYVSNEKKIADILEKEKQEGFSEWDVYQEFAKRSADRDLTGLLDGFIFRS